MSKLGFSIYEKSSRNDGGIDVLATRQTGNIAESYAMKQLANHSIGGDVTGGYMVADPERLRKPMERIETHLLCLCRKDKAKVVNIKVGH